VTVTPAMKPGDLAWTNVLGHSSPATQPRVWLCATDDMSYTEVVERLPFGTVCLVVCVRVGRHGPTGFVACRGTVGWVNLCYLVLA
jgi:hypothetical protein